MERILRALLKVPPGPVIGVIAIAALVMMSDATNASRRVPELEGLQVNPAIEKAAEEGFAAKHVFVEDGGIAGSVVRQSPEEMTIRDKGTTITLYVTRGAPQVKVPDVRGVDVNEARRRLDRGNVSPGTVTYRRDPKVATDMVITTVPAPNTLVDAGTKVEIIAGA